MKRTVTTAAVSAGTTAAFEGAAGGKETVINKKANKDMINDKVPGEDKSGALKAFNDLGKISPGDLTNEQKKASEFTSLKKKTDQLELKKRNTAVRLDKRIQKNLKLRADAISSGNLEDMQKYQKQVDTLKERKNTKISAITKAIKLNEPTIKARDFVKFGDGNAHVLTGEKHGQIAVDVDSTSGSRGAKRAIFDYEIGKNGKVEYKFADYTDTRLCPYEWCQ